MSTIDTISAPRKSQSGLNRGSGANVGSYSAFGGVRAMLARFATSAERWRQRRDLAALTDEQLRDIGVTPEDARREASRPFWD